MARRTRSLLLVTGLLVPVIALGGPAPAGAVDQDLVVSATNGAPGTQIEVSSASCVSDGDAAVDRYLRASLVVGTAPNEVLAAIGGGGDGDPAVLVVPDWVDDTLPASIEASCYSYAYDDDVESTTAFDAVAFDLEPGAGPATQTRTLSRDELLAGQGLAITGTGCGLPGAEFLGVEIFPGNDLSGRSWESSAGMGYGELDGTDFRGEAYLVNGGTSASISGYDNEPAQVDDLEEIPTDLPAGTYTLVPYCAGETATLLFEPALIEVTGSAPTGEIDLTTPEGTRNLELAGGSCTVGDVETFLYAEDLDHVFDDFGSTGSAAATSRLGRPDPGHVAAGTRVLRRAGAGTTRTARLLSDQDGMDATVTPGDDGAWLVADSVDHDRSLVSGDAVCGDPLADGFIYDPQLVEVAAAVAPPTTTTTTTPPPAPAPPANALPGRPTYAG